MVNILNISFSYLKKKSEGIFVKILRVESADKNLTNRDLRLLFRNGFLGFGTKMKISKKFETKPGFGITLYVYEIEVDVPSEVFPSALDILDEINEK